MAWFSAIGNIVKPISDVFTANTRRKQASEEGLNKIQQAQVDGENSLNLTDAQWEAVNANSQSGTWKDEYVTVVCTFPYVFIFLGAVVAAFGNDALLTGSMTGVTKLEGIGVDVGHLCEVVVYAAVGLKLWRGR